MPTARGYLSATFALDGALYASGGSDADGGILDVFEVFEPRAHRWERLDSLPCKRANLASELII